MSSNSIGHRWIHEIPHGRTKELEFRIGPMSFYENRVYSYRTVIGQYFDTSRGRVVLLNKRHYSNTTNRHQSEVSYASDHLQQLIIRTETDYGFRGYSTMDAAIRMNVHAIWESVTAFLQLVERGEKQALKQEYFTEQLALLREAFHWMSFDFDAADFLIDKPGPVFALLKDEDNLEDNFWLLYLEAHQKWGKFPTNDAIRAEWARQEQITANRRAGAQRAAYKAKETKERRWSMTRFEILQDKYGIERPEQTVDLWRRRMINQDQILNAQGYRDHSSIYLRLHNNEVQTSRGAAVPIDLDKFKLLFALINRADANQSDIKGMRLGHFFVNSYNHETGILTVDCHQIPKSEIEFIANQLKITAE